MEGEDHKVAKKDIETAWSHIHKKGRKDLGQRGVVSLEPHLEWVQAREIWLNMPYPHEEPLADLFIMTSTPLSDNVEEIHLALVTMQQEKEVWKNKYQTFEMSHATKLKEKDDLIEQMKNQEDLFSSSTHPVPHVQDYSLIPSESGAWKGIIDRYVLENEQLKEEIRKLKGKRQREEGSSSNMIS